jgi:hypothetical protein
VPDFGIDLSRSSRQTRLSPNRNWTVPINIIGALTPKPQGKTKRQQNPYPLVEWAGPAGLLPGSAAGAPSPFTPAVNMIVFHLKPISPALKALSERIPAIVLD